MSKTQWIATSEPDGKGWHARPELYRASTLLQHMTCKHHHSSEKAAVACARKMLGDNSIPDKLAL